MRVALDLTDVDVDRLIRRDKRFENGTVNNTAGPAMDFMEIFFVTKSGRIA